MWYYISSEDNVFVRWLKELKNIFSFHLYESSIFENTAIIAINHAYFLIWNTFPVSTASVYNLPFTIVVQVYCDFVGIFYV